MKMEKHHMHDHVAPTALLLVSTHCPHCHALQKLLQERYTSSKLSSLKVINIEQDPDAAQRYGVRSVPWLRLDGMQFDTAMTPAELDDWIERAANKQAATYYIEYLLLNGKLNQAINWLENGQYGLDAVLPLLSRDNVKINVRIGIGALMEHFAGTSALVQIIDQLSVLAENEDASLRADACHYLALTHSRQVLPVIEKMISDPDEQVREIARDSLDDLQDLV